MKLILISDLHAGSTVGLCPPRFRFLNGAWYEATPQQKWLWRCWEEATGFSWKRGDFTGDGWLDRVLDGDDYWLVLNGDLIEGRHHGTIELVHHDFLEHERIAAEILEPLVEYAARTYVVRGTECHARTIESNLGERLGAVRDRRTHDRCHEFLKLKPRGVRTHIQHHIGTTTKQWTSSSAFAAAMVKEQINAVSLHHEPPRILVRAHRHKFGTWTDDNGRVVVLPPWQLLTRFARKVTQDDVSVPGMVVLDYEDLEDDGLPRVRHTLFRPGDD